MQRNPNRRRLTDVLLIGSGLAATGLLGGCAVAPTKSLSDDPVAQALQQSTQQIEKAWRQVGAVSEAQNPKSLDYLDDFQGKMPAALAQKISLRWAGPIAGVTKKLAHHVGWSYDAMGNAPANGVPVFIDAQNQTIGQILRNLGYQAGGSAQLIVRPDEKFIEVAYGS
jgi:hypothetical protein